jgi:hypothetical protein
VKVLKAVDLLAADFSGTEYFQCLIFIAIVIYFLLWRDLKAKPNSLWVEVSKHWSCAFKFCTRRGKRCRELFLYHVLFHSYF